jgi:hypothetical protein
MILADTTYTGQLNVPDLQIERVDASSADLDQDVTIAQLRYGDSDFVDTVAFAVSLERKRLHRV